MSPQTTLTDYESRLDREIRRVQERARDVLRQEGVL